METSGNNNSILNDSRAYDSNNTTNSHNVDNHSVDNHSVDSHDTHIINQHGMTGDDIAKVLTTSVQLIEEARKKAAEEERSKQKEANAASYGNASKMVVLVDDEKLERMATDESFRKKYEGIIAMAQGQLNEAKNSLTSSGASVKNFGMSVDSKGNTSFFATIEKNGELQQKRIEKKLAEKKELKAKEKKEAAKEAKEERIEAAREKRAEKSVDNEKRVFGEDGDYAKPDAAFDEKEYVTIKATTLEDLLSKVQDYSYSGASDRVMTEGEKMLGGHVDFRY